MCVCVYVCMRLYKGALIYVRLYICMCVYELCIFVCMYICTYVGMYVCVCVHGL